MIVLYMDKNSLKRFGAFLREMRETAGISQSRIAKRLDVYQSTVGRYESGERFPTKLEELIEVYAEETGTDEARLWRAASKHPPIDIDNPFEIVPEKLDPSEALLAWPEAHKLTEQQRRQAEKIIAAFLEALQDG